jgi:thiol:disulfide interchange protein DsbG
MRNMISFATIVGVLGVFAPAVAGEAPRCAVEIAPQLIKVADEGAAAAPKAPAVGETEVAGVLAAPADVDKVPILKHIADSGANILDLGSAHGLRSISARRGEQFMVLQIAPDGEAAISGPQLDLSISKLLSVAGSQVTELGEAHGLRGIFLRNGQEFQVLYATPDGEATMAGVMWDATGKNLTREQVAGIEGVAPTAVIGKDAGAASAEGASRSALETAEESSFGTLGDEGAPRLWLFVDPLCSYSVRALQDLKPFVEQHRVQLAIIPVSVLDYEDQGQSTPAALALLSKGAGELATAWEHQDFRSPGSPEAAARLRTNMGAAQSIGLRGTPTMIWRKSDGSEGRVDGLPADWKELIASIAEGSHAAAER